MNNACIKITAALLASAALVASCKKGPEVHILNTGNYTDTTAPLKTAANFPIGVAINYGPLLNEPQFANIVKRDFSSVVFGYEMKHGAIVQNNGTYNFANADAMVAAVGDMEIFGHTLGWHQNQNATYLKNYAGITLPAAVELLPSNAGFESGLNGWSIFNTNGATITANTVASEAHTGSGSMKVVNPTANAGNQWKVQVSSPAFNTTPGKQYIISYWVRAAAAGGSIRLSTGPTSAQYQGDQTIGTAWQQVTWTITANLTSTTFLFDMGQAANTYYIDDASVKEVVLAPSGTQVANKVDTALGTFITTMVNRYKSRVHAWDVVNELFADDGSIRNNANTASTASDVFVWSEYLGRDYALKAFTYAKAADPNATFYINDYALESNSRKLDSLIAFVKELKSKGAKVDGIGTQMHIAWNTTKAGIDQMFQKLAATGLKVRVSELDVKMLMGSAAGKPMEPLLGYQAAMYKYVVSSYLKYIPAEQRAGITVWGVNDRNSWLYSNGTEYPLLYDNNYNKKPAYAAFLAGLRGQ